MDDAVIYKGDVPFLYNKTGGRYTEFIGNTVDTVFLALKRYHKFLISQGRNKPTMSSDLIILGHIIVTKI